MTTDTTSNKRTGGRPRTGTARRMTDRRWQIAVTATLPNGKPKRVFAVIPNSERWSKDTAEKKAAHFSEHPEELLRAAELGATEPEAEGETLDAYSERWLAERELRGLASIANDRGRYAKWIKPELGSMPLARIARRNVEEWVAWLDAKVRAGALSWKTAQNVWGLLGKLFDDATNGKALELRALTEDPSTDVRGPDRGNHKAKCYLHPSEFLALVTCAQIPLDARRAVVLAAYTGLRAAELRALTWGDIDVASGALTVHHAETCGGKEGATKTDRARRFAVEPTLLPMLRTMHAETGGAGRVVELSDHHLARDLRDLLRTAGCKRAELYDDSETRCPLTWHDLRATAGTWWAIRGDSGPVIQDRLGHTDYSMTQRYVRQAAVLRQGFGEVFPELPKCLIARAEDGVSCTSLVHKVPNSSKQRSHLGDSNPRPTVYEW